MCDKKVEDLGVLPNGCNIFRIPNEAGGFTYYSNEIGGNVMVWDTCLVNESTLLAAIVCEHHRIYLQNHKNRGWKPSKNMQMEEMAATGGLWVKPKSNAICRLCEKEFYISPDQGCADSIVYCPFCNAHNTIALAKTRFRDPTTRKSFLEN